MNASISTTDWVSSFRRIAARQQAELFDDIVEHVVVAERVGAGGDVTLSLDSAAEAIIFSELEQLCADLHSIRVVSEERGPTTIGSGPLAATLVIDPLDGSNNAARGVRAHALSIAVADGETFGDVTLGYVHHFGGNEEIIAGPDGSLEVNRRGHNPPASRPELMVALEYEDAALLFAAAESAACKTVRIIGSSTVALSYVGLGRFDGFVTGWGSRCVDIAAAAKVARTGGATVAVRRLGGSGRQDFDLGARYQVSAARDPDLLQALLELHGDASAPATLLCP